MKKKICTGILSAALVLIVGTMSAFAAEPYYRGCPRHYVNGVWVCCADVDGNGLCDTCGAAVRMGAGFIDEDGDGICDTCGRAARARAGFVDEDGDGICDNRGTAARARAGFIDENGDGICDNYSSGACRGGNCGGIGRQGGGRGGRGR